jgi:hypothetical protein
MAGFSACGKRRLIQLPQAGVLVVLLVPPWTPKTTPCSCALEAADTGGKIRRAIGASAHAENCPRSRTFETTHACCIISVGHALDAESHSARCACLSEHSVSPYRRAVGGPDTPVVAPVAPPPARSTA